MTPRTREQACVGALRVEQAAASPVCTATLLTVLRARFATDAATPGWRKNGPAQDARFLTDPGQPDRDAANRRHAAATVERLLEQLGDLPDRRDSS